MERVAPLNARTGGTVRKVMEANGRPAVKLSDNPRTAIGPEDQIARYKRVFGVGEQVGLEVVV